MPTINQPIIRIAPSTTDLQPRTANGGGGPKEIVPVTPQFRQRLSGMVATAADQLTSILRNYTGLPGVITLKLHPKALAKSHRPMALLERAEMLPIGARRLGELLLPANEINLRKLDQLIRQSTAKQICANISTIEELSAYSSNDVLGTSADDREFQTALAAWVRDGKPLLLEAFDFNDGAISRTLRQYIERLIAERNLLRQHQELTDMPRGAIFLKCQQADDAYALASIPGIRSLIMAPEFSVIDIVTQSYPDLGRATAANLPPPIAPNTLPTVGVIDSGVLRNDPLLAPWLDGTNVYVLPPETDHAHGTFVSGMIAGAHTLNDNRPEFPDCSARIHSVAAMGSGPTSIGELLERIREAVRARPDIKVWNCSLGSMTPGSENTFGHFAEELDRLADELQVLFVIAAGNYCNSPLRSWPVPAGFAPGSLDRISEPAEATRALTVGSLAHLPNLVAPGAPSPFSRRGPGPAKTPKPEVVHYGGNCCINGSCNGSGVRSILPGGRLSESIGTSFSTPLVSAIAANTWQSMTKSTDVRPETVKALVVHSAALHSPLRTSDEHLYYGFGVPHSPLHTLFCADDTFTLLFEAELYDRTVWAKTPFPVPACLRPAPNQFRGEVIMTLVYSPPVDGRQGAEYVRANVNASFGSFDPDVDGELHHHGLVPLDTPKGRDDLYEEALIDHGFKWSPVKVYRKRFPRGIAVETLRLKLELLRRAGEEIPDLPQRATVIISLRSLDPGLPVYNDGLAALRQTNWVAESVAQQTRIRI